PRESQVQVDGVSIGKLKVKAIKDVLFITLGVYHSKLRRIEKPPTVQAIGRDKIPPLLATIAEIETRTGSPKAAIGGSNLSMRRSHSLTRARCDVNHQARLLAEFGRRSARDDLH